MTSKKILSVFLSTLMIFSCISCAFPVFAESAPIAFGNCGENLTYVLTEDGTLTISGYGEMGEYSEWFDHSGIERVIFDGEITSICYDAFSYSAIESIEIPSSVETIGNDAFLCCENLTEVIFDSSDEDTDDVVFGECVFQDCQNLENVVLPEEQTSLEYGDFMGCYNLSEIDLPDTLISIGESCFYASGLTSVNLPECLESIGSSAFGWCTHLSEISIGANVSYIGVAVANGISTTIDDGNERYYVDSGCIVDRNVFEVEEGEEQTSGIIGGFGNFILPDEMTVIADYALSNLFNTESITIPASYNYIGEDAFSLWSYNEDAEKFVSSLKTVIFEEGSAVTELAYAFEYNNALESVVLPDSLEILGENTFSVCLNLKNVEIPETVTEIGSYAFSDCLSLESLIIPAGVSTIGEYAFSMYPDDWGYENSALKQITLSGDNEHFISADEGKWLVSIDDGSILFVSSDISDIPSDLGITKLQNCCFRFFPNLVDVTIPATVTTIESSAFDRCKNLTTISFEDSTTLEYIDDYFVFDSDGSIEYIEEFETDGLCSYGQFTYSKTQKRTIWVSSDESVDFTTKLSFGTNKIVNLSSNTTKISLLLSNTYQKYLTPLGRCFGYNTENTYIASQKWLNGENNYQVENCYIPCSLTNVEIYNEEFYDPSDFVFRNISSLETIEFSELTTSITANIQYCENLKTVVVKNRDCVISNISIPNGVSIKGYLGSTAETYAKAHDIPFVELECPHKNTEDHAAITKSCAVEGFTAGTYCLDCNEWISGHESIGYNEHIDSNNDKYCDNCNADMSVHGCVFSDESDFTWRVIDGTLFVIGTGVVPKEFYCNIDENIRPTITKLVVGNGITKICEHAFEDKFENLETVEISDTVTTIGSYSFVNSKNLKTVVCGSGLKSIKIDAFLNCTSLSSINFEEGLTEIHDEAFKNTALSGGIVLPSTLNYVEYKAFEGTQITSIQFLSSSTTYIGEPPESVQSITGCENSSAQLLAYNSGIKFNNLDNPNPETSGVIDSLEWSFDDGTLTFSKVGSSSLPNLNFTSVMDVPWACFISETTSVVVEDGLWNIGAYALYKAKKLTSVDFGSLDRILNHAFYGCESLISVTIPETVNQIEEYAFNCKNCESFYWLSQDSDVSFDKNAITISEDGDFYCSSNGVISAIAKDGRVSCREIIFLPAISSGVYCDNIEWAVENNILYIRGDGDISPSPNTTGNFAYNFPWKSWQSFAEGIEISGNITSIPAYAFDSFTNLEYVDIDVTGDCNITANAFNNCKLLKSLSLLTEEDILIENDAFTSIDFDTVLIKGKYLEYNCSNLSSKDIAIDCETANMCKGAFLYINHSVDMKDTDAIIPPNCFEKNSSIQSVKWKKATDISQACFSECLNLSQLETNTNKGIYVSDYAFANCKALDESIIKKYAENAIYIGENAFEGCNLNSVNISKNCRNIGYAAFRQINDIEISIPDDVVGIDIDRNVFINYSAESLILPKNVKSLGLQGICDTSPLKDIYIYNPECDIEGFYIKNVHTLSIASEPEDITIHGYKGSSAEVASINSNFKFEDLEGNTVLTDTLSWAYNEDLKTLTVSGSGKMKDYSFVGETPWASVLDTVETIIFSEGISSIGSHTFENSNANKIVLASTVKEIGSAAFKENKNLDDMNIENVEIFGISCFDSCKGFNSLVLGSNVKSISANSFANWDNLTSLRIEDGIKKIPEKAFYGLKANLVTTAKPISEIASNAFSDNIVKVLPDGATEYNAYKNYDGNTIYWFVVDDTLYFCGTGTMADSYLNYGGQTNEERKTVRDFYLDTTKYSSYAKYYSNLSPQEYAECQYLDYLSNYSYVKCDEFPAYYRAGSLRHNDGTRYSKIVFGNGITETTNSTGGYSIINENHQLNENCDIVIPDSLRILGSAMSGSKITFAKNSSLKCIGALHGLNNKDLLTIPEGVYVIGQVVTYNYKTANVIVPSSYRYTGMAASTDDGPIENVAKVVFIDSATKNITKISSETAVVIFDPDREVIPEGAEKYYGYTGSTTEEYCNETDSEFIPLDGDVVMYEDETSDKYVDVLSSDNSTPKSQNTEIATVDDEGIIHGITEGLTEVVIEYSCEDEDITIGEIQVTVLPKYIVKYITDGNGVITSNDTVEEIIEHTPYNTDWRPEYMPNDGYIFDGYDHEPETIEHDEIIKLLFTPDKNHNNIPDKDESHYTVTYVTDGHGTITGNDTVTNILSGTTYDIGWRPSYEANKGWHFSEYTGEVDTITGDITITLHFTSNEIAKQLTFFAPDRVAYNIEGRGLIIDSETLTFDEGVTVRFKPRVNYDGNAYIVYLNEKPIEADADGWYTIPEDTAVGLISLTPAMVDENTGTKTSFWEVLAQFFQKIINFFKNLFK